MSKPIKIWTHGTGRGPNPWKVFIVAEELKIPYVVAKIDAGAVKEDPFVSLNPNGRVPAIEDPNNGLVLWESGAIIEYLIDAYDKDHTLSYTSFPEKYTQNCWKHFQMSGQGPYYGQKAWFQNFHHEKLPSAVERYDKEVWRVLGVINAHLEKTGKPYLVGDKVCFADLMFIPWNNLLPGFLMGDSFAKDFETKLPKAYEWHQRLLARDGVKRALALQKKMQSEAAAH